jgi:histidinol dehydrogenase
MPSLIRILDIDQSADRDAAENLLAQLRLDPADLALNRGERGKQAAAVQEILADVARRGDDAIVDVARRFDDPDFSADQIRVTPEQMQQAASRVPREQLDAIRHSIAQVREYQSHVMPHEPPPLRRDSVELGLRFTPLDSVGLHVPGGKASYPSTAIMLAVPAQVAGVRQIVLCTPPSRFGRSDLLLATFQELGLTHVFRAGGAAAIAAMAFGTATISRVDKILGPGNVYTQLAKRQLSGGVGIDGFLGPSEILIIADRTGKADFIAADMIAQAEHDPGSCFLLTDSRQVADAVSRELERQLPQRHRQDAIRRALGEHSAILVGRSMDELLDWANRFAAEHVNVQTRDDPAVLRKLRHGGAIFVGAYSPVAAGDYVAGPSHCLPTNTTARFSSGVSVYDFLKRSSIERYDARGLEHDAQFIVELARAEQLEGHAASIEVRAKVRPKS